MRGILCGCVLATALWVCLAANAWAQTTINGSAAELQSFASSTSATNYGNDSSNDAILNTDGYVGSYVNMAAPGTVTLTVNATGTTSDSTLPELGISVNDTLDKYSVTSGSNNYTATVTLPQGMSFVRLQYDNDADSDPINGNNHSLTIHNLQVTGIGATVEMQTDTTDLNNYALQAANTYINNYRQGSGSVTTGLGSGTQVTVSMLRNAFNFGTNVTGSSAGAMDTYLGGAGTSTQTNFQAYLKKHFNMLVTSNMGKWSLDEATQNVVTMGDMDEMLTYAKEHNMTARAHNLIWGTQQPTWVNTLLTNAQSSNPTTKANAIAALNTAINNRIGYFVGGGDPASTNSTSPGNQLTAMNTNSPATVGNTNDIRSRDYSEIDVLNEPLHNTPYLNALGISGISNVYKQVQTAVNNANANVSINTNEYNVIQNSPLTLNSAGTQSGSDSYANWYSNYIANVNNAGNGKVMTGAGIEWYPTGTMPNASTYQQVLQNLAVQGVTISVPEGGVASNITAQSAAEVQGVDDIMRMMYGNPNATTFMLWSTWAGSTGSMNSSSVMVNTNWTLTATGTRYEYLFGQGTDSTATAATDQGVGGVNQDPWNTPDQTVSADSNGRIHFSGVYGEYALKVGGVTYGTVDFEKGPNDTPEETLWVKGDFDLNGKLDNGDLQALLSALKSQNSSNGLDGYQASHNMSNEEFLAICDINGDGFVNAADIGPLEALIQSGIQIGNGVFGGSSLASVPEPASAVLAAISFGLLMLGASRRRRV